MKSLNYGFALNDAQQYGNQSNYQKDMYNATSIITYKTDQPSYDEDDGYDVQ